MNKKISAVYFSATGTTRSIVTGIACKIREDMDGQANIKEIDFTLPGARKTEAVSFAEEDIVIVGVPVYAGRVPNVSLKYLNSITGNGALAVAVVVYGNRDYDDALIELKDILELHEFTVIAGAAFVGEHSFSKTLGANRPDERDMIVLDDFARQVSAKIKTQDTSHEIRVKGNRPYRPYYMPKKENGEPSYDFRKITPKTNEHCIHCGVCAKVCPMGSIDFDDVSNVSGICIKCCACIKKCPTQAKYFCHPDFLRHKRELEIAYDRRSEPEFFL